MENSGHFILITIQIPDYLVWYLDAIPILDVPISGRWLRLSRSYENWTFSNQANLPFEHWTSPVLGWSLHFSYLGHVTISKIESSASKCNIELIFLPSSLSCGYPPLSTPWIGVLLNESDCLLLAQGACSAALFEPCYGAWWGIS